MNSKLIKASLAGAAVIALAATGSGTFAAWSDFNTSGVNHVGAGVLKLTVAPNTGSDVLFDHLTMAPGGINQDRTVYIASNTGDSTPSGRLFISLKDLVGTEDGCDGAGESQDDANCSDTTNSGDLITDPNGLLQVTSYAVNGPSDCTQGYAPANKVVTGTHGGTLAWWATQLPYELTGNGTSLGGVNRSYLAPGQGLCVSMTMDLGYAANNASQGDSATFKTRFDLNQAPWGTPTTPLTP